MKVKLRSWIIIITLPLIGLASCSKDKKIARQLQKDGGIWNVSTLVYTNIETWPSGQLTVEATAFNAGTFTFKDGEGNYSYSDYGVTRSGTFAYNVEGEKVNIVYNLQNTVGSGYQNSGSYVGTQNTKNEYSLVGSEIYEDSSSHTIFTGEFTLVKF